MPQIAPNLLFHSIYKYQKVPTINVALLKETCEVAGISGFEQRVRELVLREIDTLCDNISTDNMGNLIALKKGKGNNLKKVMIAVHMDEIGFIVTHIDDKGFLKFHTIGGFDPKTLTAQRVVVHGKRDIIGVMGTKPIHLMTPEERGKQLQIRDYFIDTGLSANEVKDIVDIGSPVSRERELIEMGECVNCKSIDNRVAVFILIELLRELQHMELPVDVYAAFTVQEEVGLRGAAAATQRIKPDFSFCIDTTIAYDVPGATPEEYTTQLGKGVAIKIMDGMTICDYRMVEYMKQIADKHGIVWQPEILVAGGTDTAMQQRMTAGGSIAGAVSIPTRHIHSVIEMAHKSDIRGNIDLLKACLNDINNYDWSFR